MSNSLLANGTSKKPPTQTGMLVEKVKYNQYVPFWCTQNIGSQLQTRSFYITFSEVKHERERERERERETSDLKGPKVMPREEHRV